MLYDPKWEIKNEPLSKDRIVAWLRTKPADEIYCYMDSGNCLLGQYAKECLGVVRPLVGGCAIRDGAIANKVAAYSTPMLRVVIELPRTFGAALKRAEKYL